LPADPLIKYCSKYIHSQSAQDYICKYSKKEEREKERKRKGKKERKKERKRERERKMFSASAVL